MKILIQTIGLVLILTLNLLQISQLQAQCYIDDWTALKALYESTDGDNWTKNIGWEQVTGATPPVDCDLGIMNGIILDENGRVSELSLHTNELSGSIPFEIGNLDNSTHLSLHTKELSGSIPFEIGNLISLTVLALQYNQLSGSIPTELGNLSNLTYLGLFWNQLSGCYDSNLLNLCTQLDPAYNTNAYISSGNNFDASWYDFCATGMGACNFSSCRQSDSLALVALYNSTNGPNWTNTWNLNQPMDTWYGVTLNENGCASELKLFNNNLNGNLPTELGNLSNLTQLLLFSNQISGSIPTQLGNLSNLVKSDLSNNGLSGSIPSEIGNLNNLTQFYLSNNQLTGNIPSELGNLNNLTYLHLGGNQIDGSIPIEIYNLSNLTTLNLQSNLLSGVLVGISNLNSILNLNLSNNQFSGNIPIEISNLNNLRLFHVRNNQLTGNIPSEIGSLSNLTYLGLSGNQLSGCYDANLSNLCNQLTTNNTNVSISDNNDFDAPWEDFCNTGAGTCFDVTGNVSPGDCNTDGIVNTEDVLYWGLAEGFSGAVRPSPLTDCTFQVCADWSQSIGGVNSKHQDGDGNGIVDGQDLQVVLSNFGCINNYTAPTYASGTPVYRLPPQGINNGKYEYDLYVENGLGAAAIAHGLSFTVSSDVIPISAITMSTIGSSLNPDEEFIFIDGNQCYVVLTRTDNNDVTCVSPIATFFVEINDVPVDIPFEIDITSGSKIKADATLDNITGASAFGMYNGISANISNLILNASVTHEQCNGLGEAIAIPFGGTTPYTYAWSTGASSPQVTNLASGSYSVTVSDANGLSQSLTLQINGQTPIYDANGNLLCGNLCPDYLAPSGVIGTGLYSADNTLDSDATIPAGNTAEYKAGQVIKLDKGFKVQSNAGFSAEIEDCQ